MKIDSLDDLKAAFDDWRSKKRHAREAVPDELLQRARREIGVHGLERVSRATKIDRRRFGARSSSNLRKRRKGPAAMPTFSRLELVAPSATSAPLAEVETATGLKVRIFTQTRETLGLLSSLCGIGDAR